MGPAAVEMVDRLFKKSSRTEVGTLEPAWVAASYLLYIRRAQEVGEVAGSLRFAALFRAFCDYWPAISFEEPGLMKTTVWIDGLINERMKDGKGLRELEIPDREARFIWGKF